jgi:hypothetical protein
MPLVVVLPQVKAAIKSKEPAQELAYKQMLCKIPL